MSADNLGANLALSLAGNQSPYYCRICESPKEDCQVRTTDDISLYRTDLEYKKHFEVVNQSEKLNLKETHGVVRYCVLNDFSYFNIFKNFAVDVMHDFNEGVIPLILTRVFKHCLKKKVFKKVS